MKNPIWDIDDGDFMFRTSDNMAIDSDGHMMMRMSDNMAMDMDKIPDFSLYINGFPHFWVRIFCFPPCLEFADGRGQYIV